MFFWKKYIKIYFIGIQNSITYKTNFFFSFANIVINVFVQCSFWLAFFNNVNSKSVYGYTYYNMVAYCIISRLLCELISTDFEYSVHNDIKNGNLSVLLIKPVSYSLYQIFFFLGKSAIKIFTIIFVLVIINLYSNVFYDIDMFNIGIFLMMIALALFLNFSIYLCVSFLSFFLEEVSSLFIIIKMTFNIFSGGIFPIDIFPECIKNILNFLPFKYTIYSVIKFSSNDYTCFQIAEIISVQFFWILIVSVICGCFWKLGIKKYVAAGG